MIITIGTICYNGVTPEVYEDHCRFWYYLGKRYPEHQFFMAMRSKMEQFRARNAIVQAAQQVESDYLLMLDDDMIIGTMNTNQPDHNYEFLRRMLAHEVDICGALYYQRGGDCKPVAMKEDPNGDGYMFLSDHEVKGELQEVAVAGGGCILIDMKVFDKLLEPHFAPEFEYGTDIQICTKAAAAGFGVYLDSSIELGHQGSEQPIITSRNRHRFYADSREKQGKAQIPNWYADGTLSEYMKAAQEYTGYDIDELSRRAERYCEKHFPRFDLNDTNSYYVGIGKDQICRQVLYHHGDYARGFMEFVFKVLAGHPSLEILDFACGTAPIGFKLAQQGHKMTFCDLEGAAGFEFVKWRAKSVGLNSGAQFVDSRELLRATEENHPQYDVILLSDALEHFEDWRKIVDFLALVMKRQGAIITNFFEIADNKDNIEHVSMDHDAVADYMVEKGFCPTNPMVWVSRPGGKHHERSEP